MQRRCAGGGGLALTSAVPAGGRHLVLLGSVAGGLGGHVLCGGGGFVARRSTHGGVQKRCLQVEKKGKLPSSSFDPPFDPP